MRGELGATEENEPELPPNKLDNVNTTIKISINDPIIFIKLSMFAKQKI